MKSYKYANVESVTSTINGYLKIRTANNVVLFDSHIKGTWSRKGARYSVCSKSIPMCVHLPLWGYVSGGSPEQEYASTLWLLDDPTTESYKTQYEGDTGVTLCFVAKQ